MPSGFKLLSVAVVVAAGVLSIPASAQAWWARGGFYGPRVIIAPPVVVAPAPVFVARPVVAPYYGARWVRPHYNRYGAFVPGHWQ